MYMSENGQAKFYTLVLTTLETDCSFVKKKIRGYVTDKVHTKGFIHDVLCKFYAYEIAGK